VSARHRSPKKEKKVEIRPASESVRALTASVAKQIQGLQAQATAMLQELGAVALRDAKLETADGWLYNVEKMHFERSGPVTKKPS
jgi:hypothetical protein